MTIPRRGPEGSTKRDGQPDGGAFAGEPEIDARVRELHLLDPHPEAPRDIENGVVEPGLVGLDPADHRVRGPLPGTRFSERERRRYDPGKEQGSGANPQALPRNAFEGACGRAVGEFASPGPLR